MSAKIDKNKFKDVGGRYITQSLFLEYAYDVDKAVYTIDGEDKTYKGVVYPSLKRLYLKAEDVHEYQFATKYLADWEHWKRLQANKWCMAHIERWREELEVMIASVGVQSILDLAQDGNFQAAKFAAERQWSKKRGRPSNEEKLRKDKIDKMIDDEFREDADRIAVLQ